MRVFRGAIGLLCTSVLCSVAGFACSSEDDPPGNSAGTTAPSAAGSGSGGTTGTAGAAAGAAGATATSGTGAAGVMAGAGTTAGTSGSGAGGSGTGGGGTGGGGTGGGAGEPPAADGAWTMMGGDARGWYDNAQETTLSVENAGSLAEKWRFSVGGYPPGSPVIADGKVFVMATGGTYAIDLESGEEVWSRTDIAGTASVAYHDGSIYVHHYQDATMMVPTLYKLSAADGSTQWGPEVTYNHSGCEGTSSPILGGGKVIVGHSCGPLEIGAGADGARGGVEAHDMATGANSWTYWTVPETGEDGAMVWSSVSIDEEAGVVYATTGNNYTVGGMHSDAIHAIDLDSGDQLWVRQVRTGDTWSIPLFITGPDSDFGANPILAEVGGKKVVAAGDKGSAFWMLDRETGEILWSREGLSPSRNAANGGILMNGAFDGTNFYAISNDPSAGQSVLHAMDAANEGAAAWPARTFDGFAWGSPSLANGVLFVPVHTVLHVLNAASGETLAMFDTGGTIAGGAAAISDGKVVVGSGLQYPLSSDATFNNEIICYGLP